MNNKYKILVVEDEPNIRIFISVLLEANGYKVILAGNCKEAQTMHASHVPDLVILDLGLPDHDGSFFLRALREREMTPVIVLSARSDEEEKVRALDAGANDYVTKPFGSAELLARVRSALRNRRIGAGEGNGSGDRFALGALSIDYAARRVWIGGEEIRLTQTEYNILALLSQSCDRVVSYGAIISAVWHEGPSEGNIKRLQVNLANIRKKFANHDTEKNYIVNEQGIGYRLSEA